MTKRPIILFSGKQFTVEYAVKKNGDSESKLFIESLDVGSKVKIISLIKRFANFGIIKNKEQFKKVEGKIFEFKQYQTRVMMYFCAKGCIALTHGFIKKSQKSPSNEIDRAKKIMQEYKEVRKGFSHE